MINNVILRNTNNSDAFLAFPNDTSKGNAGHVRAAGTN